LVPPESTSLTGRGQPSILTPEEGKAVATRGQIQSYLFRFPCDARDETMIVALKPKDGDTGATSEKKGSRPPAIFGPGKRGGMGGPPPGLGGPPPGTGKRPGVGGPPPGMGGPPPGSAGNFKNVVADTPDKDPAFDICQRPSDLAITARNAGNCMTPGTSVAPDNIGGPGMIAPHHRHGHVARLLLGLPCSQPGSRQRAHDPGPEKQLPDVETA